MNLKGMALQDVLGLVILKEQFRLSDLIIDDNPRDLFEVDCLSPIYKWLEQPDIESPTFLEYINARNPSPGFTEVPPKYMLPYAQLQSTEADIEDPEEELDKVITAEYYLNKYPLYRSYFDFTAGSIRQFTTDETDGVARRIYTFPLEVQIRFEFLEPRADTIQPKGARRFLRAGNIQFIIIASEGVIDNPLVMDMSEDFGFGRPISELFRLAQRFITIYGSTTARNILTDIKKINYGDSTEEQGAEILNKLFPGYNILESDIVLDKDTDDAMLRNALLSSSKTLASFNTLTPITTNIRFAPPDRPQGGREYEPSYGLAITVPFNYEQEV